MELRSQVNIRISSDMNMSMSFTTVVDTPEEARSHGERANQFFTAWVEGWSSADPPKEES